MRFLIRKHPTPSEIKRAHAPGDHDMYVRPAKAHIWVDEDNDTMCGMYSGQSSNNQFDDDRWEVVDAKQPNMCQVCLQNYNKG